MIHDPHDNLRGEILYDGCAECERRAGDLNALIGHTDDDRMHLLLDTAARRRAPASDAEAIAAQALYPVVVLNQRLGIENRFSSEASA